MQNKKILLGVTGGIAAYKSAELIRRLREAGATVRVVMTSGAKAFITPLTLQALAGHPVYEDLWDREAAMGHIALARWADIILVAPASANFLARLRQGQADDLLSTLCLATRAPIFVAPAMNQQMWLARPTQENISVLKANQVTVLGPGEGGQACGEVGPGRLLEPAEIVQRLSHSFSSGILAGKNILITAGPTREYLDPVRFISNVSSGKMGYALAEAAVAAGANVTLISGPVHLTPPAQAKRIAVESTQAMLDAVLSEIASQSIFIGVAAVCDYRPEKVYKNKMTKLSETMLLTFLRNPDILSQVGHLKDKCFTVGFAAQTENLVLNAREKLLKKSCDLIIANQVGIEGQGFHSDHNAVTAVWQGGEKTYPLMSKTLLAVQLIQLIAEHYHAKYSS